MIDLVICDAQVHAPRVASDARVNGIGEIALIAAMSAAGVARAIIVPLKPRGRWDRNRAALRLARRHPDRFAVMGLLTNETDPAELAGWKDQPGLLGLRVAAAVEPQRTLFFDGALDPLWEAAEAHGLPVMLYAPEGEEHIGRIADRHPGLRLVVDHLGIQPFVLHDDLMPVIRRLAPLATRPNVAVKASALPSVVPGPYPYRAAHEPVRRIVEAFGPARVFWGSDLTRLPCTYRESVTMFTEALEFLNDDDRRQIMGRAICDWLRWPLDEPEPTDGGRTAHAPDQDDAHRQPSQAR